MKLRLKLPLAFAGMLLLLLAAALFGIHQLNQSLSLYGTVVQAHMAHGADPARYCYLGEVFRKQEHLGNRASEYLQVGFEVFDRAAPEAADADGLVPSGKPAGPSAAGVRGINDYTGWFAGDADMGGDYGGYDGPWPPFNDERLHRYRFTVYALDVDTLGLPPRTTGAEALAAISGHVLDQASITVTYALYPAARP